MRGRGRGRRGGEGQGSYALRITSEAELHHLWPCVVRAAAPVPLGAVGGVSVYETEPRFLPAAVTLVHLAHLGLRAARLSPCNIPTFKVVDALITILNAVPSLDPQISFCHSECSDLANILRTTSRIIHRSTKTRLLCCVVFCKSHNTHTTTNLAKVRAGLLHSGGWRGSR